MEGSDNNRSVKVQLSKGTREKMMRRKVICRTLDLSTGRIGIAPAREIEDVLREYA